MIESTMLNMMAQIKPVTVNPSTNRLANQITNPFITNEKSPRVKRFIGKVKILITGLMKVLITDNTTATTTAVKKLSIETFGSRYAVIATASAFIRSLTNIFIFPYDSKKRF